MSFQPGRVRYRIACAAALTGALAAISASGSPEPARPRGTEREAVPEPAVLVGAGDIANCQLGTGAAATARVLDRIPGTIFTAGDHAYPDGTKKQFEQCYEPTWGRHKARTRPSPGNHDYRAGGGGPYYEYFGEAAGPDRRGYYSYTLGAWHIISLNSNVPADRRSPQIEWLRQDLSDHATACTLAYWHVPVFTSGAHGNDPHMLEAWRVLYEFGADIVISGHDHDYERFAPQDPKGRADPVRGLRQFVVGTGGAGVYQFGRPQPNSEVRNYKAYGVLKLTLGATDYLWEFVHAAGEPFSDSGKSECVR